MGNAINDLLQGKGENYIFPFFWQHGEDEKTLRDYMKVIYDSNIRAVCVESRPHPDFCGEKWWADMDVILDEARKREMKVWILDDSKFPTGFANGAMEHKPAELHRQSIYCLRRELKAGEEFHFDVKEGFTLPLSRFEQMMESIGALEKQPRMFDDEKIMDAKVARIDDDGKPGSMMSLTVSEDGKTVDFATGEDRYKVFVTFLTRNAGSHRQHINMMDKDSCRILIDEVYEKHYVHYRNDFGKTIAGFFSDEPELGNGGLYISQNQLGTEQDLPWSCALEEELKKRLGESYTEEMYLLWENGMDSGHTAKVRFAYMDAVSRLVQKCFSEQIGGWCKEHGVEYIGHVIEDNNQHARTGSSLGHFFRGLWGQDMAGIDDIGGQVLPQGEDMESESPFSIRDGEFYHYAMGKLGVSLGALDPKKKGRTMCEIFGNYGWEEGIRLERYLADHFMVRGVNRFVPHAFSAKEYPDPDCPPHFYAHGHNPQYRHFGCLMNYMNRICALIDGGKTGTYAAVLYHGEAEWAGECMMMQKPARVLAEHQVDFHFLPSDVFTEQESYCCSFGKDGLNVNGYEYRVLLIPYAQYIGKGLAEVIELLNTSGKCRVIFIDDFPQGYYDSEDAVSDAVKTADVIKLENLVDFIEVEEMKLFHKISETKVYENVNTVHIKDAAIMPADKSIRILHYFGQEELFYIVNEGKETYRGKLLFSGELDWYGYDAWNNRCYSLDIRHSQGVNEIELYLPSGWSTIIAAGKCEDCAERITAGDLKERAVCEISVDSKWKRSIAAAISYPDFSDEKEITEFQNVGEEYPAFSGVIRYDNTFRTEQNSGKFYLEITDAYEGVEVFVNGKSCQIQILPPFFYDITENVNVGTNQIRIEVATTLERERCQDSRYDGIVKTFENCAPTGIVGAVKIYRRD